MLMVWDEPKREINLRTHRLDFVDAREQFQWNTARISRSHPGEDGRERFVATGRLDGRLVTLVFSLLGTEAVSVISLRPASRKEVAGYDIP